ncbi:MAG TPA: XTP/dITP diphosphatase [Bacillota bacterium]
MKQIVIATKNRGKAKEFKDFFASYGIHARSLLELDDDLPSVAETGSTFKENAALKAEQIAQQLSTPVLADDSGLEIDALGGKPGIFSARYAGEPTDDRANNSKVLSQLKGVPTNERTARFVCVLALAIPEQDTVFRTGFCEGKITTEPKGQHGFGYDPIFIPDGYSKTMAELTAEEKNRISHRSKAMKKLGQFFEIL